MFEFCWIVVSSESGLIILLLENNCIPVNRLNIVTYPKAMPVSEHIMPMRISMATISLPPNSFDFFIIYDKIIPRFQNHLRNFVLCNINPDP